MVLYYNTYLYFIQFKQIIAKRFLLIIFRCQCSKLNKWNFNSANTKKCSIRNWVFRNISFKKLSQKMAMSSHKEFAQSETGATNRCLRNFQCFFLFCFFPANIPMLTVTSRYTWITREREHRSDNREHFLQLIDYERIEYKKKSLFRSLSQKKNAFSYYLNKIKAKCKRLKSSAILSQICLSLYARIEKTSSYQFFRSY